MPSSFRRVTFTQRLLSVFVGTTKMRFGLYSLSRPIILLTCSVDSSH